MRTYRVSICLPFLKQYRVPLLLAVLENLPANIRCTIYYGDPPKHENVKGDNVFVANEHFKKTKSIYLFDGKIIYQNILHDVLKSDLILYEQAVKSLNYWIYILLKPVFRYRLIYWGHGYNRQGNIDSFVESLKRVTLKYSDSFFAYTAGTARYLSDLGYKNDIVVLYNTINETRHRQIYSNNTTNTAKYLKEKYNVEKQYFIFVGSLYKEKEIQFLIDSFVLINKNNDYNLVLIGDGKLRNHLIIPAPISQDIIFIGPLFGDDKLILIKHSLLFLNPGLVGLSIIDSITLGIPFITTDYPFHSPEIEYLEVGINGEKTEFSITEFAKKVGEILSDRSYLEKLRIGAVNSSEKYNFESYCRRFSDGIVKTLQIKGE